MPPVVSERLVRVGGRRLARFGRSIRHALQRNMLTDPITALAG